MIKSENTLNGVIKSYSATVGINISIMLFIVLFPAYSAEVNPEGRRRNRRD